MEKSLELFIPGRLCLIGEHSDWAGGYRTINQKIIPGQAIVTGIEQGIYAKVEKSDLFIIESDIPSYQGRKFECPMIPQKLNEIAKDGGFFSYVAGVASYISENFNVKGLKIYITKMDLPLKSGLSSSAAICVLVTRAFNILYNLHLSTVGEMSVAYCGERKTPSQCGRLDQACAYGVNPVNITFSGNEISVKPLKLKVPVHFVVADLNSSKDTVKILSDLNKSFPFSESKLDEGVQQALGSDNATFIEKGIKCLEKGDLCEYGKTMKEYQANFDKKVAPASKKELSAPILHSILNDENILKWTLGGKGVGSQGDGSVQFLAKDEECQKKVIDYLKNEKKMPAFPLTLNPKKRVRKAIIPVAGFGTRLFPMTKVIKKDFFPIMDNDGILKPAIIILLEQLVNAGIENICLVIGEGEKSLYDSLFGPINNEFKEKLSEEKKKYEDFLESLNNKVTFVTQKERLGFGHAVYLCREFSENEPVLLLLGDMIYHSNINKNCMEQMIDAYENCSLPVISLHKVEEKDVIHYGIIAGEWENEEQTMMKMTKFCEKPSVEYAKKHLKVSSKNEGEKYYAVFGQYILTKEVFDELEINIKAEKKIKGEFQLTDALEQTMQKIGMKGFLLNGKSYDIGLPEKYFETIKTYNN